MKFIQKDELILGMIRDALSIQRQWKSEVKLYCEGLSTVNHAIT